MISKAALLQEARERALRHHDEDRGHQRAHQALTSKLADTEQVRDDLAAILQRLGLATCSSTRGLVRFLSDSAARPLEIPLFCLIGHALGGGVATHKVGPTGTAIDAATANRATARVRCHIDTRSGRRLWLDVELKTTLVTRAIRSRSCTT